MFIFCDTKIRFCSLYSVSVDLWYCTLQSLEVSIEHLYNLLSYRWYMLVNILYKSVQKPQRSDKKKKLPNCWRLFFSAVHFLLHLYLTSIFNLTSREKFQPKPLGEKCFFFSRIVFLADSFGKKKWLNIEITGFCDDLWLISPSLFVLLRFKGSFFQTLPSKCNQQKKLPFEVL